MEMKVESSGKGSTIKEYGTRMIAESTSSNEGMV